LIQGNVADNCIVVSIVIFFSSFVYYLDDDETETLAEAATHLNEAMKSYHQFIATSNINKSSQAGVDADLAKQIQMEKLKREKQIEEGEAFRSG
jgi:hypothetical protein